MFKISDPGFFYPDPHQTLRGSILGRDSAYIQVSWKSIQQVLSNPDHKPTQA